MLTSEFKWWLSPGQSWTSCWTIINNCTLENINCTHWPQWSCRFMEYSLTPVLTPMLQMRTLLTCRITFSLVLSSQSQLAYKVKANNSPTLPRLSTSPLVSSSCWVDSLVPVPVVCQEYCPTCLIVVLLWLTNRFPKLKTKVFPLFIPPLYFHVVP